MYSTGLEMTTVTYSIVDNYIKAFSREYEEVQKLIAQGDFNDAEKALDRMGNSAYEVRYYAESMEGDIEDLEIELEEAREVWEEDEL